MAFIRLSCVSICVCVCGRVALFIVHSVENRSLISHIQLIRLKNRVIVHDEQELCCSFLLSFVILIVVIRFTVHQTASSNAQNWEKLKMRNNVIGIDAYAVRPSVSVCVCVSHVVSIRNCIFQFPDARSASHPSHHTNESTFCLVTHFSATALYLYILFPLGTVSFFCRTQSATTCNSQQFFARAPFDLEIIVRWERNRLDFTSWECSKHYLSKTAKTTINRNKTNKKNNCDYWMGENIRM